MSWMVRALFPTPPAPTTTSLYSVIPVRDRTSMSLSRHVLVDSIHPSGVRMHEVCTAKFKRFPLPPYSDMAKRLTQIFAAQLSADVTLLRVKSYGVVTREPPWYQRGQFKRTHRSVF